MFTNFLPFFQRLWPHSLMLECENVVGMENYFLLPSIYFTWGASVVRWLHACDNQRSRPAVANCKRAMLMNLNQKYFRLALKSRCLLQTSSSSTKHSQSTTFFPISTTHTLTRVWNIHHVFIGPQHILRLSR